MTSTTALVSTTLPPTSTATPIQPSASPSPTLTLTPTPPPATAIPIIEYHHPNFALGGGLQMTPAWFAEQLQWLADQGYTTLNATDLLDFLNQQRSFPQKSVVISFDLGTAKYSDYAEGVIPLLRQHGFQAIFFLLVNESVIGDDCTHPDNRFCWDDLRTWQQEGLISVGSHGIYHPDYANESDDNIRWDMTTSKNILEQKLGQPVLIFAYPFDSSPARAQRIARSVGYEMAVSGNIRTNLGLIPNDPDRYNLPRLYPYAKATAYPILNASQRSFAETIEAACLINNTSAAPQPTVLAQASLSVISNTPTTSQNVQSLLNGCARLPGSGPERTAALERFSFATDLSAQVQAQLPALSVRPSCNIWPNNHPEVIVLHYTAGELASTLAHFQSPNSGSAHYVIDRDGSVYQLVPEALGSHHASCYGIRGQCETSCPICEDANGNLTEPYLRSIGIELVNQGRVDPRFYPRLTLYEDYNKSFGYAYWEDYSEAQLASLVLIVKDITARWGIPLDAQHVIGHYRIQSKPDPGPALNLFWARNGNPPRAPIFTTP
jgi:N-acetyl-anhydromuramyl-L-alanine amidase AmpD/peptidoglycan/xylan/chitin deacetylase (PgdA/CDA1 family)